MEAKLTAYHALLARWNRRIRLVSSVGDEARFEREHVEDVRLLLPFLSGARTLLDLGTGAGIPGIVIKILMPELVVTLLDATRKKINFCEEAIRVLGLGGVRAHCGRAEDPEVMKALGTFDAVVSRATWKIDEYIEKSNSYMNSATGSTIIAFKGSAWKAELEAAGSAMERFGVRLIEAHHYRANDRSRSLLIFGRR